MPEAGEQELPPGWVRKQRRDGKAYYEETSTNQISYDAPQFYARVPEPEPEPELDDASSLRSQLAQLRADQAKMDESIKELAARLEQAHPDDSSQPEPDIEADELSDSDDEDGEPLEPAGWSLVAAFAAFVLFALLYFASGSPALAMPVERDLACELDPSCGSTSFDDLEKEIQSQHFHIVSSHTGKFGIGLVLAAVVIAVVIWLCGCAYRKVQKPEEERRAEEQAALGGEAESDDDDDDDGWCWCCYCCGGERYCANAGSVLKLLLGSALLILVVQDLNRPLVDRIAAFLSPGIMDEYSGFQFLLLVGILACIVSACGKALKFCCGSRCEDEEELP